MPPFTPTTEADTERFIAGYRDAVRELESASDELAKVEWQKITQGMRSAWAKWQSEDCLCEMAFGEPD